jgi:thioesterase domain-containing protein
LKEHLPTLIVLPGADGRAPNLSIFTPNEAIRVEKIAYPGWRRYSARGFSLDALIAELVARIGAIVPNGPIGIVGISIGGHLGYATALRLRAIGREIAGFCAVDTFMISSAAPTAGWWRRALTHGTKIVRERRFGDFPRFVESKFWRALMRLAGDRLPQLAGRWASARDSSAVSESLLEAELGMRLLIREAAPWVAALDRDPVALDVPAVLLRVPRSAGDDPAWRRRCPKLSIYELPGQHDTLFDAENIALIKQLFVEATRAWY